MQEPSKNEQNSENFLEAVNVYSEASTIHSLNYIGKKNIHWFERLFWILAFVLSVGSCCYLVYQTIAKWERDPVLVSFNERLTPISQIPFPAITICPASPFNASYFDIEKVLSTAKNNWTSLSSHNREKLKSLDKICDFDLDMIYYQPDLNHIKLLLSLTSSFEHLSEAKSTFCQAWWCNFRGIFRKIVTERGTCFTFNMLDQADLYTDEMEPELRLPNHEVRSKWTVYGYDESSDAFAYPVRNLGSGQKNGLELNLHITKQDMKDGALCFKSPSSIYMAFHSPDEVPRFDSDFISILPDVQTSIAVHPKVTSTSNDLRSYRADQRQCYFDNEKKLKFFKTYSQSKCLKECFANYMLQECQCVAVYLPHEAGAEICEKLTCLKETEFMFNFYLFEAGLVDSNKKTTGNERSSAKVNESIFIQFQKGRGTDVKEVLSMKNPNLLGISKDEYGHEIYEHHFLNKVLFSEIKNKIFKRKLSGSEHKPPLCDCLPACSSISYDVVVSQLNLKSEAGQNSDLVPVKIYLKDDYFLQIKRTELYNWVNFLSNCGGFLGLLMGGSFLSLVEIFYHFGLKPCFSRTKTSRISDIEE